MLSSLSTDSPYILNPLAVQTAMAALAVSVVGIYALLREQGSRISVAYFLLTESMGVWLFAFSHRYSAVDVNLALW